MLLTVSSGNTLQLRVTVNASGWLAGATLGSELDSGSIKLDYSGNLTLDATGQVTTAPKAVVQAIGLNIAAPFKDAKFEMMKDRRSATLRYINFF